MEIGFGGRGSEYFSTLKVQISLWNTVSSTQVAYESGCFKTKETIVRRQER